jgi:hypothetical protein
MLEQQINIMGWNTRGLNDQDRRDAVYKTIASSTCHIFSSRRPSYRMFLSWTPPTLVATVSAVLLSAQLWALGLASSFCGMTWLLRSITLC